MNNSPIQKMVHAAAILAPMSGVTDMPFRMMARRFGCAFAFTEMVDVNGIIHNNKKTFKLLEKSPNDTPLAVQLVGEDAEKILYAARICEQNGFDQIDINAACPVRKVVKGGKGAALLTDPKKLAGIILRVVKELSIPISVKIRSGWDENNLNYLEVAELAESSGASAICIHARTKEQMYKGKVDYNVIKEVKEKLNIPVFASGNIFKANDVLEVIKNTGCDAVYMARGALGKPWIFKEINNLISGKAEAINPSFTELKDIIIEHFSLSQEHYGAFIAVKKMYKHLTWYLKRYKNLDLVMRRYIKDVKDLEDLRKFLERIEVLGRGISTPEVSASAF